MWTLAFDMTTRFCNIALLKDDIAVDTFSQQMDFGQSEILLPEIKSVLEKNKLKMQDLNLIAVCNGPGSFTGVRSSLSVAKSFKLVLENVEVVAVNAFDIYLHQIPSEALSDLNAIIIETKRDDFYFACYGANLEINCPYQTAFSENIATVIQEQKVTLAGDGVSRFLKENPQLKTEASFNFNCPDVQVLGVVAVEKFKKGSFDLPMPLYLKGADVCVK